jgi:predicted transcriptional regulator
MELFILIYGENMSPKELQEIVYGFRTSRIVLTSIELKLYDALEDGEQSSNEISKKLSTNEKAIDRLMNTLCALDLLQKKNGKFSNTEFSSRYLVKGKPDYISNLFHSIDLENFMKKGKKNALTISFLQCITEHQDRRRKI